MNDIDTYYISVTFARSYSDDQEVVRSLGHPPPPAALLRQFAKELQNSAYQEHDPMAGEYNITTFNGRPLTASEKKAVGEGIVEGAKMDETLPSTDKAREWTMLACIEPAGQGKRFFTDDDRKSIWICDNSGENPDETDDGPLRLDAKRDVTVGSAESGRIYARVPVCAGWDESVHCGVTLSELSWLVDHGWVDRSKIEYGWTLRPLLDLLGVAP